MNAPEPSPSKNPGWMIRYPIYLGLVIGVPWLVAEAMVRDCRGEQNGRGDDGLCGLAYVAVIPIGVAIMLVVLLAVEIVWWSRRSRR